MDARYYNYGALAAAVLNHSYTVETAINKISPAIQSDRYMGNSAIDADPEAVATMAKMRSQGTKWADIGKAFGMSADSVWRRVQRMEGR